MTLANDIRALRDRVLGDLDRAHDYYTDTKAAWEIVQDVVADGRRFTVTSAVTGTTTTESGLVVKSAGYVDEQLAEATFQQFLSMTRLCYPSSTRS